MQIISSLLSLQSTQVKDERDLDLFIDSLNRVKSMAKVHERLYRSEDILALNLQYGSSVFNNISAAIEHHRVSD